MALKFLQDEATAEPFGPAGFQYGGDSAATTWDEDKMFACVCDSAWDVGYGSGETQAAQWFGADCSQRASMLAV